MSQDPAASPISSAPAAMTVQGGEDALRGWRLRLFQALWALLVSCDLVVLAVSLPAFYRVLHTLCPGPSARCLSDQLTPRELIAFHEHGISLHAYALAVFSLDLVASLTFLLVGAVIIWRRMDTRMGLFVSFLLINFGSLGLSIAHATSLSKVPASRVDVLASGISLPLTILAYLCLAFFFFTFPNGRLVPHWSWALVGLWIANFVVFAAPLRSPLRIDNWPQLLQSCWLLVVFGGSLSTQIYRYRHDASRIERQQIKWLIYGFVPVLLLPICFALLQVPYPSLFWQAVTEPLYRLYYLPVPLCISIAILRYRLWDIDVIINRTLVYGGLTALVVGGYILIVGYLGAAFQTHGSLALSILATGVVAVLFQPARQWLQRNVNHLLYGDRDDPYAAIARLGRQLEAALAPDAVLQTVAGTIKDALKLPYAAIALPGQGTVALGEPRGTVLQLPLMHAGETVGQLLLSPRSPGEGWSAAERRLLNDLAQSAGGAVQAVRLNRELQRSRERLVLAREEERRRLRRDLHDGLGPILAGLTFKVDAARNVLRHDTERADRLLTEAQTQAQDAIFDIRRLVYNLRPPALDELGLLSALREQTATCRHQGVAVDLDAPDALPPLPAALEVALYRIAQEALTNVARHAHAQHCLLRLSVDVTAVHLRIADDGQGIPAGHRIGVGLQAMQERAGELGGQCAISRGPGGGTLIQVTLPLSAGTNGSSAPTEEPEASGAHRDSGRTLSTMRQEE